MAEPIKLITVVGAGLIIFAVGLGALLGVFNYVCPYGSITGQRVCLFPQWKSPLVVAAECSWARCVQGCNSGTIAQLRVGEFKCADFCVDGDRNGIFDGDTNDDKKICNEEAQAFPVIFAQNKEDIIGKNEFKSFAYCPRAEQTIAEENIINRVVSIDVSTIEPNTITTEQCCPLTIPLVDICIPIGTSEGLGKWTAKEDEYIIWTKEVSQPFRNSEQTWIWGSYPTIGPPVCNVNDLESISGDITNVEIVGPDPNTNVGITCNSQAEEGCFYMKSLNIKLGAIPQACEDMDVVLKFYNPENPDPTDETAYLVCPSGDLLTCSGVQKQTNTNEFYVTTGVVCFAGGPQEVVIDDPIYFTFEACSLMQPNNKLNIDLVFRIQSGEVTVDTCSMDKFETGSHSC